MFKASNLTNETMLTNHSYCQLHFEFFPGYKACIQIGQKQIVRLTDVNAHTYSRIQIYSTYDHRINLFDRNVKL